MLTSSLTGATYELADDGLVRVTEKDGRTGLFRPDGRYVSGELRYADPHLTDWVGGKQSSSPLGRMAAAAAAQDD